MDHAHKVVVVVPLVDPHTVFENLFHTLDGQGFLKTFQAINKLSIGTLSRSSAMTSFERPMPKLFSTGVSKVIRMPESHFDKMLSYEDWILSESGLLAIHKDLLSDFESSHRASIQDQLEEGSAARLVAMLLLSESISIIDNLFKFMEEYMKHLTTSKFDTKRAWHITTRLAKRLLVAMFEPRQGVIVTFTAGDPVQVS